MKGKSIFLPPTVLPCSAYNLRYTSLGSTYNTFRNPALLVDDEPINEASSREHKSASYIYNLTRLDHGAPFSASAHHLPVTPNLVVAAKMTTQPISDSSTTPIVSDSTSSRCTDGDPKVVLVRNPSSRPQQQGDLPELTSLQLIASDPETYCGVPVQRAVKRFEGEEARDGLAGDAAAASRKDNDGPASHCTPNKDADLPAPAPRYRPAYELADGAHERLGRTAHPPVLTT